MKGLLIKDMMLIKNKKSILLIIIFMEIIFLKMGEELSFIVGYSAAVLSILIISTISYDEFDNGYGYLFTLPISRSGYVLEKYLLCVLNVCVLLVFGEAICAFAPVFNAAAYADMELEFGMLQTALTVLLAAALVQSVIIPMQIKFGAEKSRIVLIIVMGCAAIGAFCVGHILDTLQLDFSGMVQWLNQASTSTVVAAVCIASIVMLAVSCGLSILIMKKKQF